MTTKKEIEEKTRTQKLNLLKMFLDDDTFKDFESKSNKELNEYLDLNISNILIRCH